MSDTTLRTLYWPRIDSLESARSASRAGVAAAGIVVVVTVGFIVWGLLAGNRVANVSLWSLLDVGLFLAIGFGIYRVSRTAAVAGLCLYLVELWFSLSTSAHGFNSVLALIIIIAFLNGIRGTFAYHRLSSNGASTEQQSA